MFVETWSCIFLKKCIIRFLKMHNLILGLYITNKNFLILEFFWAFRQAVGLSAISLLAFVFSSLKKICCLLSVVCCPKKLAKDAAPIPNAAGALN